MDLGLAGKRALVTGASSGIGVGIAKQLAEEGVRVVVHGRDPARTNRVVEEIGESGGWAAPAIGDLINAPQAEDVMRQTKEAVGDLDILVNNAGGPTDPSQGMGFFDLGPDQWVKTYERNVISALRLCDRFTPAMREAGWGRVIQITSGLAYVPHGKQGDYTASKAALNNFTYNLSRALANTGVTVNGVVPGMMMTPMLENFLKKIAEEKGFGNDLKKAEQYALTEQHALSVARFGRVEDVAKLVAFLASPVADYINGTNTRVDGGGVTFVN